MWRQPNWVYKIRNCKSLLIWTSWEQSEREKIWVLKKTRINTSWSWSSCVKTSQENGFSEKTRHGFWNWRCMDWTYRLLRANFFCRSTNLELRRGTGEELEVKPRIANETTFRCVYIHIYIYIYVHVDWFKILKSESFQLLLDTETLNPQGVVKVIRDNDFSRDVVLVCGLTTWRSFSFQPNDIKLNLRFFQRFANKWHFLKEVFLIIDWNFVKLEKYAFKKN